MRQGTYTGKQALTASDPSTGLHETCWIWSPTPATELWILYRGPAADHPYVDPGPAEPHVWLEIEYAGGPELFADVPEFMTWVLARLFLQGRQNLPSDIELRSHMIV
ncbi:MAG: hypothetical protein ACHQ1G_08665 [Planctomycetota bacterium]